MRGGVQLTIAAVLLNSVLLAVAYRCDRTPEGFQGIPKSPMTDNRFQLKISGSPEKYVAGEGYTISLQGQKSQGQVAASKFIGFSLAVEPQFQLPVPLRVLSARDLATKPVGTFSLYGDTLTKFSPTCPNLVTHTSSMPKTEVQVRWTAPPPGSGCVVFRATVVEQNDVWYQDDGLLSKVMCEEEQPDSDSQPVIMEKCCACDEAKYEVTFEGLWSRHTHPKDFPRNGWLTRFSDVIGASHSPNYKFWEYGGVASEGLKQVAEKGSTRTLESELKANSADIRTIIKARGINYPNVTAGKTFAVFRVNKEHHLMSLVSMIDPSPDWIVGVSALELCMTNCSWIESETLNLYPWDAGTDSGISYFSPNQPTVPQDKIRRITSSFPNDPRSPFYDPTGVKMKPLARLHLTRQRLYEKPCEEGPSMVDGCPLTDWSSWGPCATSHRDCGQGKQYRRRDHRIPPYHLSKCRSDIPLTQSRHCIDSHCRLIAQPVVEPVDARCVVGEWGEWSSCIPTSHTCREGVKRRYRSVKPRGSNKYCITVPHVEEEECPLDQEPVECDSKRYKEDDSMYRDDKGHTTCCGTVNYRPDSSDYVGPDEQEPSEYPNQVEPEPSLDIEEGGGGEEEEEEEGDDGWHSKKEDGEAGNSPDHNYNGMDYDDNRGAQNYVDDHSENNNKDIHEVDDPGASVIEDDEDNTEDEGNNYESMEEPSGECAMSQWSFYGPCSVSCGVGVQKRVRKLLNPVTEEPSAEHPRRAPTPEDYGDYDEEEKRNTEEYAPGVCSIYKVVETQPCNGSYLSCDLTSQEAREKEEEEDQGLGEEEGEHVEEEDRNAELQSLPHTREGVDGPVIDCKWSRWSQRSACKAECNQTGYKEQSRHILTHTRNGGKPCTGKSTRRRTCVRKCDGKSDCKYSNWSPWTECTATCGLNSVRYKSRVPLESSSAECNDRIRKKNCDMPHCPHQL